MEGQRESGEPEAQRRMDIAGSEDEIDLMDYIEVIVRRRWLIFWGTVFCVVASLGNNAIQEPSYRAEAYVLPSQNRELELDTQSAGIVRRSGTYLEALKGPSIGFGMLNRTVPRTAEGQPDSVQLQQYFGGENVKQALDGLAACSQFMQDASGVLTIAVTLRNPTMAASIANAYVEELTAYYTDKQQEQAQNDIDFIESRLKTLEAELRAAEDSLVAFHRANVSIGDPEISLQLSHLQHQVNLKLRLYTTVAERHELARIEAWKEMQAFKVLNYARSVGIAPVASHRRTVLSAAVGLVVSVFLAFILEYVARTRQSGRMEPILNELQRDAGRVRRLWSKKPREKRGQPLF